MLFVFFTTLVSVCVAEMGDKTQFLVIGLTTRYKLRDIAIGVVSASVLLNAMGVFIGSALCTVIPMDYVSLAAGLFFLIFAVMALKEDKCEDEEVCVRKSRLPVALSIGTTFFIAELGDKTQLSAIAFSAKNPGMELVVFLGATAGLIIGDALGVIFGLLLHRSLPERAMKLVACGVFTAFGFATVYPALKSIAGLSAAVAGVCILAAAFAAVAAIVYVHPKRLRGRSGEK